MRAPFSRKKNIKNTVEFCQQERQNKKADLTSYLQQRSLPTSSRYNFFEDSTLLHKHKKLISELIGLTFSEYMELAMFDKQNGYYSSGKVDFKTDFITNATRDKGLAFINVLDMFQQWTTIGRPKQFNTYEGGAGNGQLAFDTLSIAEKLATENLKNNEFNSLWHRFYEALQYVIVELSPALVEQQTKLCKHYVDSNKLTILNANALDFVPPKKVHRFCSNELLDDLPLEAYRKNSRGKILTLTKLQVLPKAKLEKYFPSIINEEELKESDQYYREVLKKIADTSTIPTDAYIINKKFAKQLPQEIKTQYQYCDLYLPVECFDISFSTLKQNSHLIASINSEKITYCCIYLSKLAETLNVADRVLFFDYGGIGEEYNGDIRCYTKLDEKRLASYSLFDALSNPNYHSYLLADALKQDSIFVNITHDVDYSEVKRSFEKSGFTVSLYGHQSLILSTLDKEIVEQAVRMYNRDICDEAKKRGKGLQHEHNKLIINDLRRFATQNACLKLIVLENQTKVKNYYRLPDLIANFNLWRRYENHQLKQQKSNLERALIPISKLTN